MTKVAIIGNAGGGKSTLARLLSQSLNIDNFTIDNIQWQPGWQPLPEDDFNKIHNELLLRDTWIIDGWGNWPALTKRFSQADTIIFIDFPLALHYWWAIKRQVKSFFKPYAYSPPGCPLPPVTIRMMRVVWTVHHHYRPKLLTLIEQSKNETTQVFHIRSRKELNQFKATYC